MGGGGGSPRQGRTSESRLGRLGTGACPSPGGAGSESRGPCRERGRVGSRRKKRDPSSLFKSLRVPNPSESFGVSSHLSEYVRVPPSLSDSFRVSLSPSESFRVFPRLFEYLRVPPSLFKPSLVSPSLSESLRILRVSPSPSESFRVSTRASHSPFLAGAVLDFPSRGGGAGGPRVQASPRKEPSPGQDFPSQHFSSQDRSGFSERAFFEDFPGQEFQCQEFSSHDFPSRAFPSRARRADRGDEAVVEERRA